MAFHSAETAGSIHVLCNWEYADASARTGATGLVAADVGKAAKQLDNDTFWVLTNHSPVTWTQLGGNDADAIHKSVAAEINGLTAKSTPIGADLLLIEDSAASNAKKKTTFAGISHTLLADKGSNTHAQIDSHLGSTSNPHSVTYTQAGAAAASHTHTESQITDLNHTDANAIHKTTSAEISGLTDKASPVAADVLVIEDSAASFAKKKVSISNLPGGVDTTAIHKATSAEISAMTEKTTPVNADLFVIEDSAASNAKKKLQIGNLPVAYVNSGASEAESSTTSSSFQQKLRVTFTATSGVRYLIMWYFELGKAADEDCEGRVQLNDTTTICTPYFKNLPYATRYNDGCGGFYLSSSLSGTVNVDADYRAAYGAGSAYIRAARLSVYRVNN